jgi:hypothetical protein
MGHSMRAMVLIQIERLQRKDRGPVRGELCTDGPVSRLAMEQLRAILLTIQNQDLQSSG